jgi:hypothetical protein
MPIPEDCRHTSGSLPEAQAPLNEGRAELGERVDAAFYLLSRVIIDKMPVVPERMHQTRDKIQTHPTSRHHVLPSLLRFVGWSVTSTVRHLASLVRGAVSQFSKGRLERHLSLGSLSILLAHHAGVILWFARIPTVARWGNSGELLGSVFST